MGLCQLGLLHFPAATFMMLVESPTRMHAT